MHIIIILFITNDSNLHIESRRPLISFDSALRNVCRSLIQYNVYSRFARRTQQYYIFCKGSRHNYY